MIQHLVFDFGGVILDLDGVHTGYPDDLAIIFDLPVAHTKQIWDENKTLLMTGKESPLEFLTRMKTEHELNFDLEQGHDFWNERNTITPDRIDWKLIAEIQELRNKYKIHMLTDQIRLQNGADEWIDEINKHFHTILRSYEQGFRKPYAEAYTNLLEKIEATEQPDSVIFIDDSESNITAANEAGINGILYTFKDHTSLFEKLAQFGV